MLPASRRRAVSPSAIALAAVALLINTAALLVDPVLADADGRSSHAQLLLWVLGLRLAQQPFQMDVNSATVAELSDVPGIQRRQALRIIAGRPYATLQELARAGLSPGAIDRASPFLRVGDGAASALPAAVVPAR